MEAMSEERAEVEWYEQMGREFEAAPGREAKMDVLRKYMDEGSAYDTLRIMLGEAPGDRIDLADGGAPAPG